MFKRFMQSVVRAEIEDQTSANLKTVLWIYGAIGAAASVFGVGVAIKEFVDRVESIKHKLSVFDRGIGSASTSPLQPPSPRTVPTPSERGTEPAATVSAREITFTSRTIRLRATTSIAIFQTSIISPAIRTTTAHLRRPTPPTGHALLGKLIIAALIDRAILNLKVQQSGTNGRLATENLWRLTKLCLLDLEAAIVAIERDQPILADKALHRITEPPRKRRTAAPKIDAVYAKLNPDLATLTA